MNIYPAMFHDRVADQHKSHLSHKETCTSLILDLAFFCLRDCSGHLVGVIIVNVDDMLLATDNSHHAESHISLILSTFDIKDAKRADESGGAS